MTFTFDNIIQSFTILILVVFLVALIYLLTLLYRANKLVHKIENLSSTFESFVREIVPAIVNVGTLATAVQHIMHYITTEREKTHSTKEGKNSDDK